MYLTDDCERSDLANPWSHEELQALRDIMKMRCRHPELHGAAMLSAVGCGAYKDVNEAAEHIVKVRETLEPQKELVKRYDEKYHIWREYYPALKDI